MPKPLLPPRGIFISTRVLFDTGLKPQIRDTLLQLMALAWSSSGGRSTPLLSYPLLAELTGKSIKTLYGHVAVLRDHHAVLRLQRAGDGTFTISFSEELFCRSGQIPRSEILEMHDEEEDSPVCLKHRSDQQDSHHHPDDHAPRRKYAQRKVRKKDEQRSDGASHEEQPQTRRLSAEFERQMREAGVFPVLFGEIAASSYSEEELRALLAWTKYENAEKAAPLFVGRVRAGACAPQQYSQPPCPRCGGYGDRHDADCPRRYISGKFKDVVQH